MIFMQDTKDGEMRTNTLWGKVTLAVLLLTTAYIAVLMQPESFKQGLRSEISAVERVIGSEGTYTIISRAKSWYTLSAIKTGIAPILDKLTEDTQLKGDEFWRVPMQRISENIKLVWYQACVRASIGIYWVLLLLPMCTAALADGWYRRRIKQHEFSVSSTGAFRVASWIGALFSITVSIYLLMPSAGLIGPVFPLLVAIAFSVIGRHMLANAAKVM